MFLYVRSNVLDFNLSVDFCKTNNKYEVGNTENTFCAFFIPNTSQALVQ